MCRAAGFVLPGAVSIGPQRSPGDTHGIRRGAWRAYPYCRLRHDAAEGRRRRAGDRKRDPGGLSPSRYRGPLRQRERGRAGDARRGRAARRHFPHHQGTRQQSESRRLRALARLEPEIARPAGGGPAADPLAEPERADGREHRRTQQGQARRVDPAYRGRELHGGTARRGQQSDEGAAGHQPDRGPAVSRPDQGDGGDAPPRHEHHGLLPDRARARAGQSCAGEDRRRARQEGEPGLAALAGAAGHHRHPGLRQA